MQPTPSQAADTGPGAAVDDAAAALQAGRLVIFPTETVYGIAADATGPEAVAALRQFKGRPAGSFAVHLPDAASARHLISAPNLRVRRVIEKLLCQPVTLRLTLDDQLRPADPPITDSPDPGALVHDHTLALRCPDHPLATALLSRTDRPVIASSAAIPGAPPPTTAAQAAESLAGAVVLDGGRCRYGRPSTAVRLSLRAGSPVLSVEREGVLDARTVERLARFTILLVCTGNTCRSPMAEALTRSAVARHMGIPEAELHTAGIDVSSAGVFASAGAPASPEAVEAMRALGLDLHQHRSKPATGQLVDEADLVLAMGTSHVQALRDLAPAATDRIHRLDPAADIADPIGQDLAAYQRTAEQITRAIEHRLQEHLA